MMIGQDQGQTSQRVKVGMIGLAAVLQIEVEREGIRLAHVLRQNRIEVTHLTHLPYLPHPPSRSRDDIR